METRAGLRLQSAVCSTQVVVVRAPAADVDIRCGGAPMTEVGSRAQGGQLDGAYASGTLLGKRYADDDAGLELLCTAAGEGSLSVGEVTLEIKGAKPLPSSD